MPRRDEFEGERILFSDLSASARHINGLVRLDRTVDSIANFGCGEGLETFALGQAFGARHAVGIDIDAGTLLKTTQTIDRFRSAAVVIANEAGDNPKYQQWWLELIPSFVKGLVLDQIPEHMAHGLPQTTVRFIQADITRPLNLKPDHFDLVYCDYVLYHVFCDHGASPTLRAVREMARVGATGGHVVAVEPPVCSPERPDPLDFTQFFEDAGLRPADLPPPVTDPEDPARVYRYAKPPKAKPYGAHQSPFPD
ncbi:MAG TPA: class I SAM-dependent methyltransferase [Chloroflexi bacterium]|nr:class I SAM-dependent methyltransferase [Chloroflexota bacterium]